MQNRQLVYEDTSHWREFIESDIKVRETTYKINHGNYIRSK